MTGLKTEERPRTSTLPRAPEVNVPVDSRERTKAEDNLFCSSEVQILILDDDPAVGRVIQTAPPGNRATGFLRRR